MKISVRDLDIIFLSYDEPNADKHYADLQSKIPWAKRVHGVKGSDAAHKACAELAETDRFVVIDGDNIVDKMFLYQDVEVDETKFDLNRCVFSWSAINVINGLEYGNGSIKSWTKDTVNSMKTHEAAPVDDTRSQIDFCWNIPYLEIDKCFSTVYNNGSAFQAWRAGFREGVKMGLNEGKKPAAEEFLNCYWKNLHRLYIWMMVGADLQYGEWAIFGARQGLAKLMFTDWDYIQVRDFDHLDELWQENKNMNSSNLAYESAKTGTQIIKELNLPITEDPLTPQQSIFVKTVFHNPER